MAQCVIFFYFLDDQNNYFAINPFFYLFMYLFYRLTHVSKYIMVVRVSAYGKGKTFLRSFTYNRFSVRYLQLFSKKINCEINVKNVFTLMNIDNFLRKIRCQQIFTCIGKIISKHLRYRNVTKNCSYKINYKYTFLHLIKWMELWESLYYVLKEEKISTIKKEINIFINIS